MLDGAVSVLDGAVSKLDGAVLVLDGAVNENTAVLQSYCYGAVPRNKVRNETLA